MHVHLAGVGKFNQARGLFSRESSVLKTALPCTVLANVAEDMRLVETHWWLVARSGGIGKGE